MHSDDNVVRARLARAMRDRIRPNEHSPVALLRVEAWHVGDGHGEPVAPDIALGLTESGERPEYRPFAIGQAWGVAWATTWFRFTGTAPERITEAELLVDLGWQHHSPGFQAEGLAYRADGAAVKGLHPHNNWIPLDAVAAPGADFTIYVEAAANPVILDVQPFRPTAMGDKSTAGNQALYTLDRVELTFRNVEVSELIHDLEVLSQLMEQTSAEHPRYWSILRAIERALDALGPEASNAAAARAELAGELAKPAHASAHQVTAVGHAHIDSAWLWPVRETVRKVARTVSNVVNLMDRDSTLVFAMSSAQQYEWLGSHRPELFERMQQYVSHGRFVPVGGMWVESDTNMPGSEALARQFVYGKRYFLEKFDIEPREVWLPDSFGYSAALPQIVSLAGCDWFLTQKISWNATNQFPHHTFWWEGIDGTRVFTHFPPVDTYNSELSGAELHHAVRNFKEKGYADHSLVPFGHGDGGGGPTRDMLARARRLSDLEGSPRVRIGSASELFTDAQAEYPHAPVWVGELYLELHRGTYTSQLGTKQGNRRCERLLREAELLATMAHVCAGAEYPYEQLRESWKTVLLLQFHDILPGSSIAWVHREARERYSAVVQRLEALIDRASHALRGNAESSQDAPSVLNLAPQPVQGVPPLGIAVPQPAQAKTSVIHGEQGIELHNGLLRVVVDELGRLSSVFDLHAGRELVPPGLAANVLQLHRDEPVQWDAWDIESHAYNHVVDLDRVSAIEISQDTDTYVAVDIVQEFGSSTATLRVSLASGQRQVDCQAWIDWHEREKLLKVAIPIDVQADDARFETQFGHLKRPIHQNTSWDAARFEVCAHRFVHVAEADYGVALVNDSSYGHDVARQRRTGGGASTLIRLSLLRAPLFPDPETDQGRHQMRWAIVPTSDVADAVQAAYRINAPARQIGRGVYCRPLARVADGVAVLETVKLAEDGSGDVVLRLYEARGARTETGLEISFDYWRVDETDLLERPFQQPAALVATDPAPRLRLRPFQIVTLRFTR